jgi:hypothetical protein
MVCITFVKRKEVVWRQCGSGFDAFSAYKVRGQSVQANGGLTFRLYVCSNIEVGLSTFQWMPPAIGLVTLGEAAVVPENLIQAIKRRVDEIAAAGGEVFDGLKGGDVVVISDGPFAGYEAIFDARLPGSERVRVLLQLLNSQRRVPVELNAGQIQRRNRKK